MAVRPIQFNVYKGMGGKHGAIQFTLQPGHYYHPQTKTRDFTGNLAFDGSRLKDGWKVKEGAVFIDITSTKDKNIYDWDNKIVFALSIDDIGKILLSLATGETCKIMHDPGAATKAAGVTNKVLSISSPSGTKVGVIIQISETTAGETKTHKVPLAGSEVMILKELLSAAIPRLLAWTS